MVENKTYRLNSDTRIHFNYDNSRISIEKNGTASYYPISDLKSCSIEKTFKKKIVSVKRFWLSVLIIDIVFLLVKTIGSFSGTLLAGTTPKFVTTVYNLFLDFIAGGIIAFFIVWLSNKNKKMCCGKLRVKIKWKSNPATIINVINASMSVESHEYEDMLKIAELIHAEVNSSVLKSSWNQ